MLTAQCTSWCQTLARKNGILVPVIQSPLPHLHTSRDLTKTPKWCTTVNNNKCSVYVLFMCVFIPSCLCCCSSTCLVSGTAVYNNTVSREHITHFTHMTEGSWVILSMSPVPVMMSYRHYQTHHQATSLCDSKWVKKRQEEGVRGWAINVYRDALIHAIAVLGRPLHSIL